MDLRHSLAYTNTVSIPVNKNAHQVQFPETPSTRINPVTKFGVSAEKVVATIDTPNNHHGILRPERKKSEVLELDFLENAIPINSTNKKYTATMVQSRVVSVILLVLQSRVKYQ